MRHPSLHHRAPMRPAARRALALHRPRPRTVSRGHPERGDLRASDVVLALLGLTLLGAFCLVIAVDLLGRALAA
ncbi:hypothetical protein [Methylobacterium sp. J-090]|uniref:hypothetical protein n=1 Tax=Methylobacterium sp. J-090 TaxID=2836666 RepID=UPI001FB9C696|nr:hypothetical protein [Methylobacterium sp. J-090]MCJ2082160.1 hypothetical protein [Methylobacterium sp. J-090]